MAIDNLGNLNVIWEPSLAGVTADRLGSNIFSYGKKIQEINVTSLG